MRKYPIALIFNKDEKTGKDHCERVARILPQAKIVWVTDYFDLDIFGGMFWQVVDPNEHLSWLYPARMPFNYTSFNGGLIIAGGYEVLNRSLLFDLRRHCCILVAAENKSTIWRGTAIDRVPHAQLPYPLTDPNLILSIEDAERVCYG